MLICGQTLQCGLLCNYNKELYIDAKTKNKTPLKQRHHENKDIRGLKDNKQRAILTSFNQFVYIYIYTFIVGASAAVTASAQCDKRTL